MNFKKTSLLLGLVAIMASLTSCGPKLGGDDYFKVKAGEWASTYRKLRLNNGYASEQFSLTYDEDDHEYWAINDVKALVVPVDFTDFKGEDLPKGEEGAIEDLQNACFGQPEDTSWHSLASYYKSTSYDQCHISGEVEPFFHLEITARDFQNGENFGPLQPNGQRLYKGAKSNNATQALVRAINDLYKPGGERAGRINLDEYDCNNDNYIDSLIIIYTPRMHEPGLDEELFWAFSWKADGAGSATEDDKAFYTFFWCSYHTFYEHQVYENGKYRPYTTEEIKNGTAKVDSHTLIHEFGHNLSLPDYYDTDYTNNPERKRYFPFGGLDMMDFNIGDHNSMSKAWYGWTTPYVVEGTSLIELSSTTDTGNFIIIPQIGKWYKHDDKDHRWDGTMLDQYIMIEFLTPTGVAYQDGVQSYDGSRSLYYNIPGIRITHVDARIGVFSRDSQNPQKRKFSGYTIRTSSDTPGTYVDMVANNTGSRCEWSNDRLLMLVSKTGKKWSQITGASNADLFLEGDTFNTKNSWNDYKLFDVSGQQTVDLGFSVEVVKINGNESATIQITRK